jgi:hypothetical protein
MRLPGQNILIASDYELVNELCDEKRFPKTLQGLKVCMVSYLSIFKRCIFSDALG